MVSAIVNALSEYRVRVGQRYEHAQYPVAGILVPMWRTRRDDNTHIRVHRDGLASNRHVAAVTKSDTGVSDQWGDLIRATKKASGCSEQQAINAALSTEAGRYAFAQKMRADRISTGQFTKADLQCLDDIAKEQNAWLEMRKVQPSVSEVHTPSAQWNIELDKLRRLFPGRKESALQDELRRRQPHLWQQYKAMRKLGGGNLPQVPRGSQLVQTGDEEPEEATSDRTPPSQAPQWRSPNRSRPVTPEPKSEHMDEKPKSAEVWNGLVDDIKKRFGWSHEKTVRILKQIPASRALLYM